MPLAPYRLEKASLAGIGALKSYDEITKPTVYERAHDIDFHHHHHRHQHQLQHQHRHHNRNRMVLLNNSNSVCLCVYPSVRVSLLFVFNWLMVL